MWTLPISPLFKSRLDHNRRDDVRWRCSGFGRCVAVAFIGVSRFSQISSTGTQTSQADYGTPGLLAAHQFTGAIDRFAAGESTVTPRSGAAHGEQALVSQSPNHGDR